MNELKTNINFQQLCGEGCYTYKSMNNERLFNAKQNKNGSIHVTVRRIDLAKKLEKITSKPCRISKPLNRGYCKYTQTITSIELVTFINALNGYYFDERLDNRNATKTSTQAITTTSQEQPKQKASTIKTSSKKQIKVVR